MSYKKIFEYHSFGPSFNTVDLELPNTKYSDGSCVQRAEGFKKPRHRDLRIITCEYWTPVSTSGCHARRRDGEAQKRSPYPYSAIDNTTSSLENEGEMRRRRSKRSQNDKRKSFDIRTPTIRTITSGPSSPEEYHGSFNRGLRLEQQPMEVASSINSIWIQEISPPALWNKAAGLSGPGEVRLPHTLVGGGSPICSQSPIRNQSSILHGSSCEKMVPPYVCRSINTHDIGPHTSGGSQRELNPQHTFQFRASSPPAIPPPEDPESMFNSRVMSWLVSISSPSDSLDAAAGSPQENHDSHHRGWKGGFSKYVSGLPQKKTKNKKQQSTHWSGVSMSTVGAILDDRAVTAVFYKLVSTVTYSHWVSFRKLCISVYL